MAHETQKNLDYQIFISYRREGGSATALHLYYLLNEEGYKVSFDVDTLREGKFAEELFDRIDRCTDFVIILNKDAFERTLSGNCPRENDWMRMELARAIEKGKNIIPVMLSGYEMPHKINLPEDIAPLVEYNGPHHSDEYFDSFFNKLKSFLYSKPNKREINIIESVRSVTVQHDTLKTPDRIRNAKNNIYLHAAYYPKYADDSYYDESFRIALRNNPNLSIKVILTDINTAWANEFAFVLRNHFTSAEAFRDSMQGSINFFKQLRETYPNNVEIAYSSALPFCPYIIIDDSILVGHYLHARIKAPVGIWMEIKSVNIIDMYSHNLLEDTQYLDSLDDESKAISRYVEDFQYAFNAGEKI